jgi:hypothetical protein
VKVVPGGFATTEGDSNNISPWDAGDLDYTDVRYQQVYAAAEFAALGQPGVLTDIAFRVDRELGSAFSAVLPDVQLVVSSTGKLPGGLDTVFANNLGADATTVFSGALSLSSAGPTGDPTSPFDVVIHLTTPFVYDPSAGNLIWDVQASGNLTTTVFDATQFGGSSTSRLRSMSGGDFPPILATDSYGLITKFTFQVPEPATGALLGLSLLALTTCTSRRSRRVSGR